jgi:hypothetical protein
VKENLAQKPPSGRVGDLRLHELLSLVFDWSSTALGGRRCCA